MNWWLVGAIVIGLLAITGVAIASFTGVASADKSAAKPGCGSCNGECTSSGGCGSPGCTASSTGSCGCGKQ